MNVNKNLIEIACAAYYSDGSGLVTWNREKTTTHMQSRIWIAMEAMLTRVVPLIAAGEPAHSEVIMLESLKSVFAVWGDDGHDDTWERYLKHHGAQMYDVYAPAIRQALDAVFGDETVHNV